MTTAQGAVTVPIADARGVLGMIGQWTWLRETGALLLRDNRTTATSGHGEAAYAEFQWDAADLDRIIAAALFLRHQMGQG